MKNTVFPHKLWRPFWMECLGYFLDPNGYASNQDTASYQHHSGIEITIKNMIAHMLSEQLYLFICLSIHFIVFIHVIPGTWSISKYCSNCIRIPSWLRKSHCGERRSHQRFISAVGLFPAIWRFFFYFESIPGCIFSTQTCRADNSSKIYYCGMTCSKRNQNFSIYLAACIFLIT